MAVLSAVLFGMAAPLSKLLLADLNYFLLAGLLYLGQLQVFCLSLCSDPEKNRTHRQQKYTENCGIDFIRGNPWAGLSSPGSQDCQCGIRLPMVESGVGGYSCAWMVVFQ